MAEQVTVKLEVDADGAVKAVKGTGQQFEELSESSMDAQEALERTGDSAIEASQRIERGAEDAAKSTRQLANTTERAANAQVDMQRASGNATQILFSAGDAVQDVQFGFAGAANNIAFMAEQFADVQRQAGGTTNALKLIGGSLLGAGGVIFAFQTLLALAPTIISFFSDTEEGAENAGEALQEMADAALEVEGVGDLEFEPISPERAERILRVLEAMRRSIAGFGGVEGTVGQLEEFVRLAERSSQATGQFFQLLDKEARKQLAAVAERERQTLAESLGIRDLTLEQARTLLQQERTRLGAIEAVQSALQEQVDELDQQGSLARLLKRLGLERKEAEADVADEMERQVRAATRMRIAPALNLSEQLDAARRRFQQLQDELAAGTEAPSLSQLIAEGTPEVLSRTEREIRAIAQALREASTEQKGLNAEQQQYADLVAGALSQGFVEFGRAIAEGQSLMEAFGQAAASIIGAVASAMGQQLIAMGTALIASSFVPGLQGNAVAGAALIAAGGALMAASGALGAIGGSGGGASAGGGGNGQPREGGVTGPSQNLGTFSSAAATATQRPPVTVSNDNSEVVAAITEQTRRLEQVERTVRVSEAYNRIVDYDAQQGARGKGTRLNHG